MLYPLPYPWVFYAILVTVLEKQKLSLVGFRNEFLFLEVNDFIKNYLWKVSILN